MLWILIKAEKHSGNPASLSLSLCEARFPAVKAEQNYKMLPLPAHPPPPPVRENIVLHETGPWREKGGQKEGHC